jgi:hypothetical protein
MSAEATNAAIVVPPAIANRTERDGRLAAGTTKSNCFFNRG